MLLIIDICFISTFTFYYHKGQLATKFKGWEIGSVSESNNWK